MFDLGLKNKVVVITGATNGIGKAALFEIAKHGPRLFITYRNKIFVQIRFFN